MNEPEHNQPENRPVARPQHAGDATPASEGNAPILILGLGNDILSDDAVGLFIARELRPLLADNPRVKVIDCMEMGLSLLDHIVGHRGLVVVDSVQTGQAPPGSLHQVGEEALKTLPGMSPHSLGVGEILTLGRTLDMPMPERVTIFAVEVEDPFTLSTQLTPAVAEAMPAILERIISTVELWCAEDAQKS